MAVPVSLVWFRQDLRVKDNPALNAGCDNGKIIPVYIHDTTLPKDRLPGSVTKWWLHHSLNSLNDRLNGHLHVFKGNPKDILLSLTEKYDIEDVYWNRCYEPWNVTRDKQIKQALKAAGKKGHSFNGSLLWEPWDVANQSGAPYKVFTPFYRKGCLASPPPRYPKAPPARITYADIAKAELTIDDLLLLPRIKWAEGIAKSWQPGEEGAANRLADFIDDAIHHYKTARDFPAVAGTSKLSPHLHFGEISPNQVWYAIKTAYGDSENKDIDTFLSELGWREFAHHLIYHYPDFPDKNFNKKFDYFPWRKSSTDLKAWQQGKTGIPIVDAGMRELWHTGYMHNRVRMIVGSFLVKNLLIDWREGEAWFWDCLADADVANNSAGWQWIAGSGADAAPYFRVFNPVLQGEKFDKQGEYVRAWCPELKKLPNKYLHKPWDADDLTLRTSGVLLGRDYPNPLVNLKISRERALAAFNDIKGK